MGTCFQLDKDQIHKSEGKKINIFNLFMQVQKVIKDNCPSLYPKLAEALGTGPFFFNPNNKK